ncbi:MAG: S41 family peptidase [Planctomycetota bacterium]
MSTKPGQGQIDEDWEGVLVESLPTFAEAEEPADFRLALAALVARVGDGHANLLSRERATPPFGDSLLPVSVRFLGAQAVVAGYTHAELGPASGLAPGDVIVELDGEPVEALLAAWSPYYGASNDAARHWLLSFSLTLGSPGPCSVHVEREGEYLELTPERASASELQGNPLAWSHDRPGDAFRLLSDEVAYLKLSGFEAGKAEDYVRAAEGTRGWVIDIRGYPAEFAVFALGGHLVGEPTPFARFTHGDLSNPGAFLWTEPLSLPPREPRYAGRVAILVDEASISQSEYTAMAFRAAPDALVVGSTTAGADGNVSMIPLPGGLLAMMSGIGVFYPDRTPTQRIGIVPDIEVVPTAAGLREGRDEVLERALRELLGDDSSDDEIRRLVRE